MNNYEKLGLSNNPTDQELKERFRYFVKKYHPDKYLLPDEKKEAEKKFISIQKMFDQIKRDIKLKETLKDTLKDKQENKVKQASKPNPLNDKIEKAKALFLKSLSAYEKKDLDLAILNMEDAIQIYKDPKYLAYLGLFMFKKGWIEYSRTFLIEAIGLNPKEPIALEVLKQF